MSRNCWRKTCLDGFLLLEDLGNTSYLSQLTPETAKDLYADALQALLQLQQADCDHLPAYNERTLRREMELMPEWFLKTHLGFSDERNSARADPANL